jgi:hypothetical protein
MTQRKSLLFFLLLVFLVQACNMQATSNTTEEPVAQKTAAPAFTQVPPTRTQIAITATKIIFPSVTPAPKVTITAVKGNLFIRRGPDMAYNPIDVLYKGTTVTAYMRDVLSKWVQITIPKSDKTGWVSLQTEYSKVEGNVDALPEFKITDWPLPSYVRNCTHHKIVLYPGEIYIDSEVFEPENVAWVYPGHYYVFDIDMPDPVRLESIVTSEGKTVDVRIDGADERRKCE